MKFATAKQLHEQFGVGRQTIVNAIKQNKLKAEPFAGRWLICIDDFREWHEKHYDRKRAELLRRRWERIKREVKEATDELTKRGEA